MILQVGDKMMLCYIIKFGQIEQVDVMLALELTTYYEAREWIIESLQCDAEYYNARIKVKHFKTLYYEEYEGESIDLTATAILVIEADDMVGIDVREDELSDMEEIIESSLNVVSKIIMSGQLEERV